MFGLQQLQQRLQIRQKKLTFDLPRPARNELAVGADGSPVSPSASLDRRQVLSEIAFLFRQAEG